MTDPNFPKTTAKLKAKYERLENKVQTVDDDRKSTDKYLSEKALVNYIGVL